MEKKKRNWVHGEREGRAEVPVYPKRMVHAEGPPAALRSGR